MKDIDELNKYSSCPLSSYNYDTGQVEDKGTADMYLIAKNATDGHVACLMENLLNSGRVNGKRVGAYMAQTHRTLQGLFVNFCLQCLLGYAEQYAKDWGDHTDARNATALKAAKKVGQLMNDGVIPFQPLI